MKSKTKDKLAKLLLSCDEYIYRHDGKYYIGSEERNEFLHRYLRVFEEVRLALRCIDEPELKKQRIPLDDERIEIVPLPIFHGPVQYVIRYFSVRKAIKNITNDCDAIVLRLPSTVAQRISKEVIRKNLPYATEIVFDACDGAETANNIVEKLLWKVIDKQMRHTCYNANGVSCVTEHYLQRRYFSKKANAFTSHYSSLALDKSFFISARAYPDHQPLTIAHVDLQIGLFSRKGTAEIIRALKMLKDQGIVVNVKFAGDDWDGSSVKIIEYAKSKGVGDQVECIGFLTRPELNEFLNKSDLFVLPTKAEGLPRVIIEAIAKGMPCVTTPVSGNPELIPKHFLVGFSDVETMAERIKEIVTNQEVYEKCSKENYEHSLQYEASILEARRDAFYTRLKETITK